MFSFFSRKKNSPDSADEGDPIPGPGANPSEQNDFIFVDRRNDQPPAPTNSIYPPMPGMPYNPVNPEIVRPRMAPVNFLEGVPFQLSPELCKEDTLEIVQLEVDGILALMTKRLQFDQADYDFSLERGLAE